MRPVEYRDIPWMIEAYKDWHTFSGKEPITEQKVIDYVRRWIYRDDENCLVNDDGCAFITYRADPEDEAKVIVDNILTHPDHRQQGHAKHLIQELTDYLIGVGFIEASFKTLPGPIRNKYPTGIVRA